MRDLLIPVFGETGAVVAQFLLTVVIVLGLIVAAWWVMRRYSGVHFGGIGRGRVPRLAVIDAIAVDRRRKLVLVRRDNVEHLLLLGGPSDVVVEGTIQRVRQRSAQAAAQAAAARAAMQPTAETAPEPEARQPEAPRAAGRPANEPIPFPVARSGQSQPAAAGNGRSLFRTMRQPPPRPAPAAIAEEPAVAPAPFVAPEPAPDVHQMAEEGASAPPQAPEEASAEVLLSEVMVAEAAPPPAAARPPATYAQAEWEAAEAARQSALDLGDADLSPALAGEDEMVPADTVETAAEAEAAPATAPSGDETAAPESPARVSDLEREMARLLDEITTRRSS